VNTLAYGSVGALLGMINGDIFQNKSVVSMGVVGISSLILVLLHAGFSSLVFHQQVGLNVNTIFVFLLINMALTPFLQQLLDA
jgi:cell shape-determining protein MreD